MGPLPTTPCPQSGPSVADAPRQAQAAPGLSGVSQLHLGAELGPAVRPAEAVVADAEEPLGEAEGGHQQGDAQEEQRPLAHAGLLLVQLQAQEGDAAVAREGAFGASWAGEARRAGGGQAPGQAGCSPRGPPRGPGRRELWGRAWGGGGRGAVPEFGVQLY